MPDRALRVTLTQPGPIPLDVAFACGPGDVLALFGPSGSGKTTVLRTVAGLYRPQTGHVAAGDDTWLDTARGIDVPPHLREVGFVFQEYALFPHMTARGNVEAALSRYPRRERRARAEALLEVVHLGPRATHYPASLSGGERQRVAVARALAREPRVLLMDEPFAAVDRALRRALQNEIAGIRRSIDIPIVLVTHDFEDVVRLATHLAILDKGHVVAQGPLQAMTSRPDLHGLREMVGLGSVIDAVVTRLDTSRRLAEVDIGGQMLVTAVSGLVQGLRLRVRIPAREVILATEVPAGLSVHNVVPATVTSVNVDAAPDVAIVQLAVGRAQLLAEVTRDAAARLRIAPGLPMQALIKSVSLEVLVTEGAGGQQAAPEEGTRNSASAARSRP